jgi:integrase
VANIRKRLRANGSEYFTVSWRDDAGKQCGHSFDVLAEAELFKAAMEMNNNNFNTSDAIVYAHLQQARTVSQVLTEHVDLLVKPTSQTIRNYRNMINDHIGPTIGGVAVNQLDIRHLTTWVRQMQDKKLAPKTIRNVHGLISSGMETAVRLGYRPDNPCRGVALPTTEHAEDKEQFLSWDEWQLIHKHLNPLWQPLALFLVMSGARFGEATAVKVGDFAQVRADGGSTWVVRINKSWKRDGVNGYYIAQPKTASSKRSVSIPPVVVEALRPAMEGVSGDTLVFRTSKGGRVAQKYLWNAWQEALEKAREEDPMFHKTPRLHDLRHTSASWGLQGGLSLYEVARRLGHSSTATTERVYAHLMHESHTKGAAVFGKISDRALEA